MKQFLNVLYRRILYKIPLKLLLVILAVVSVFIACTKAENVEDLIVYSAEIENFNYSTSYKDITKLNGEHTLGTICVKFTKVSGNDNNMLFGFTTTSNGTPSRAYNYYNFGQYICGDYYLDGYLVTKNSSSLVVDIDVFVLNTLLQTTIPVMTSLECQTEYNLIPISSVDQNYCTSNNLCPAQYTESQCKSVYGLIDESECTGGGSCPICPVGSGGVSSLYINDILHIGSPFIYMTIPQEISWDYEYTQGGTNMLIDVEGYNVDYDKIENIVNTQSYTPDEYDLNSIITNVIPLFVPGLVIILFIYFVFKLIKKIF